MSRCSKLRIINETGRADKDTKISSRKKKKMAAYLHTSQQTSKDDRRLPPLSGIHPTNGRLPFSAHLSRSSHDKHGGGVFEACFVFPSRKNQAATYF